MNIAAYCRVSTDKSDQLNSMEAQKKFFEEYTLKNGHHLASLYADEGISGTKIKNRKEFLRLMEDAKNGRFDMVVVKDISRFARNTVDFLQSIRALKALNIETVFLTSNQTVLGNSEFILTIFGALAQEESANTSKRVKFGKKLNAEKGRVPNLVYGYDKSPGDYFNLTINEQEAYVLKQIFDWYTEWGYGTNKIASMLNEMGRRTKRGCKWTQNAVSRILNNEIYTGKIINGKQEVEDFLTGSRRDIEREAWMILQRPKLRIISDEQAAIVKKIMHERSNTYHIKKERQSNKYLFSTLIKCKECGYSFKRIERRYKNTTVRWACSQRNGKGHESCCNSYSIEESALTQELSDYFTEILCRKDDISRDFVRKITEGYDKNSNKMSAKEWKKKEQQIQAKKQKYIELFSDELMTKEELKAALEELKQHLDLLNTEFQLSRMREDIDGKVASIIMKTFRRIEDIVLVDQLTNSQLKQVIQCIEAGSNGQIDIHLKLL